MGDGLGFLFLLDQEEDPVKGGYIDEEHGDHADGVEDGVPADEVIEDVVGGTVALPQEHVFGVQGRVCDESGGAEDGEDGEDGDNDNEFHQGETSVLTNHVHVVFPFFYKV